jgi:hypothetical protein
MRTWLCASALLWAVAASVAAQRAGAFGESRDHAAINYTKAPESTAATALNARLDAGSAALSFEPGRGYLKSLLAELAVPIESQILVYSETSFQAKLINQRNPRALYFNDRVAVGWVRGGPVLEVAAQDPRQGTVFYTLNQVDGDRPRLVRSDNCLSCHLSWETLAVPGPFVLTVMPRASDSDYANGSMVDHRTPIEERWGGWFVTGARVPPSMANVRMIQPDLAKTGGERVAAKPSLEGVVDLTDYLTPYSDVAALMVLEHQTRAANLMTRAGWEYRVATHGRTAAPPVLPSRVTEAVSDLVDYLLFSDEPRLPSPVTGSSGFAAAFAAAGPRDGQGRSLRDLQLTTRLMKYPLSYVVYGDQFLALPEPVRAEAWRRIFDVLAGRDTRPKFAHLSAEDRRNIREILAETIPEVRSLQ